MADNSVLTPPLIFILSQPRSGSSMLQRVLGSHSQCMTTSEPWVLLHPIYALRPRGLKAKYSEATAYRGLMGFLSVFEDGEDEYYQALRQMWSTLYAKAAATAGKPIFIDKTPRYYLIGKEINRLFPDALMIVLIRNPMAVLVSVLDTWVKEDWALLSNPPLKRDLFEGPGYLQSICEQVPGVMTVRYEDFVDQPEVDLQRICERMGIVFEPGMLRYGHYQKPAGELGDPVGVDRETAPVQHRKEQWKARIGSSVVVAGVARGYLKELDEGLLLKWGYSPEEMWSAVAAGERWWSRRLPWDLLLQVPSSLPGKLLKPCLILFARFLERRGP
ncbi:MAG: sulfotransferase [Kiritimatiellae bacterium]|nr:sulfotransferase [Kiritimatiellia bacterium]